MTSLANVIYLDRVLRWNRAFSHGAADAPINFISMFSGIEAASVAFGPLDWRPVVFAEIEKFPSAVLAHHYPDVRNVGDMSRHDWSQYRGRVDIVCGGPPCQAFSVAGLRESLDDARGNLSLVYMKALHAIKPRNAIVENVPGWLSTKDNAFGCFLAGLVGAVDALPPPNGRRWPNAGMVAGPKGRAAWRVLDAQFFGLAQRRKRVIVVADFGNGADPAAVLFEPEGVRRDSPPRRETGEGVAAAVEIGPGSSGRGVERTGDTRGQDPVVAEIRQVSDTVTSKWAKGSGGPAGSETSNLVWWDGKQISATLTKSSHAQMMPDKGNFQAVVQAIGVTGPISHALKAEGAVGKARGVDTGRGTPIAFSQNQLGEVRTSDVMGTLNTNANASGRSTPLALVSSAVRRLTPRECERLQGFPDDYTRIPWRSRPASECPDGPRYKALGNSWAVPLFTWLGERIQRFMPAR